MIGQYRELFSKIHHQRARGPIGLLSNQVAFDWTERKYLFQLLQSLTTELTVFVPEHGLFSELQDQKVIDNTSKYDYLGTGIDFQSVYGSPEHRLGILPQQLSELNTLIIDIQDVGVRYYTYLTTVLSVIHTIADLDANLNIIVVDHPNLAGRQVEGTMLESEYSSFIGWPGIPNRYGLTLGELCLYSKSIYGGGFTLEVIPYDHPDSFKINPSPNIPSVQTCAIFSGQCLIEGTNMSEGRGTTRPFEIFGAPFLKDLPQEWAAMFNQTHPEAVLRHLQFVPTFHKHSDALCYGFQLHPLSERLHSLRYSLSILRSLKQHSADLQWLTGPYEAWSDRPAIELLAGDPDVLNFLNGEGEEKLLIEKMKLHEQEWINKTKPFLIYIEPLFSILE